MENILLVINIIPNLLELMQTKASRIVLVLFIVFAVLVFFLGPIEIVAWLVSVFH